jgi:hypothetical protein
MQSNKLGLLGAAAVAAAAMLPQAVLAQPAVSGDGAGSGVIVPYYTVNGGWATLVNIQNTTDNSIAVKFRMHEGQNSRDVLDFNVVLSPFDVWTASITQDANGRPFLSTQDRSCTSPLSIRDSGQAASEVAFTDFTGGSFRDFDGTRTAGTPEAISRMSEGYIAVLAMGEDDRDLETDPIANVDADELDEAEADFAPTAYWAKHVNGEPRNCEIVDAHFAPRANNGQPMTLAALQLGNDISGEEGSGDPIARRGLDVMGTIDDRGFGPLVSTDSLKVTTTLVNLDEGTAANIPSLSIDSYGLAGNNLVTAQEFPFFLEPTLASDDGLWSTDGLPALETGISAVAVENLFTTVPGNGARAEWVISLPTKRFHVDQDFDNIQAACNKYRNLDTVGGVAAGDQGAFWDGFDVADGNNRPSIIDNVNAGDACDLGNFEALDELDQTIKAAFQDGNEGSHPLITTFGIYDREERIAALTTSTGTRPSPAPPGVPEALSLLDFETNVIRIGRDVANLDPVLESFRTVLVDVTSQGLAGTANAGWMRLNFETGGSTSTANALPVSGFLVSTRNFGAPGLNFSTGLEHRYVRP